MPRKKAVAKPNLKTDSEADVKWECFQSLQKELKSLQVFVAISILFTVVTLLMLLAIVVPMDDRIDRMANEQGNLAFYQKEANQNLDRLVSATNDTSPFCFGYDQLGNKGWSVDISKITKQCEGNP